MGVALYRRGVMAQQDSTGDLSMGGRRLRRVVAGREFQSLTVRGKTEYLYTSVPAEIGMKEDSSTLREKQ